MGSKIKNLKGFLFLYFAEDKLSDDDFDYIVYKRWRKWMEVLIILLRI